MALFEAVPSYFGGKRRLAKKILVYAEGETFVDVFMGGGSVSLLAKHLGYRVLCNDLADRSAIVGRAIIENGTEKITDEDVARLFVEPDCEYPKFVGENFCPDYFTEDHAAFLDRAFSSARAVDDPVKRDLLLYLLIRFIYHVRPFGAFMAKYVTREFEKGNVEMLAEKKSINLERLFRNPYTILKKMQRKINRGIVDNGQENRAYQLDALEFVAGVKGDTAYIDPPYPGTQAYESFYAGVDSILAGEALETKARQSRFNAAAALDFFTELLSRAQHIPRWIISFGGPKVGLDDILAAVRRFREAEAIPIRHRYTIGSSKRDIETCSEMLIVAA
jgi:adenine-specific DNA methylase